MLGLPRLFKDKDVSAEYPLNINEEYINEQGFLLISSSDSSIGSSAIALFRCSRILARVLDTVYSTTLACDEPLRRLEELQNELEGWRTELVPNLQLEFVDGVPATNVVHSQPLLLVCSTLSALCLFLFLSITLLSNNLLFSVSQFFVSHTRAYLLIGTCLSLYSCFDSSSQYPL